MLTAQRPTGDFWYCNCQDEPEMPAGQDFCPVCKAQRSAKDDLQGTEAAEGQEYRHSGVVTHLLEKIGHVSHVFHLVFFLVLRGMMRIVGVAAPSIHPAGDLWQHDRLRVLGIPLAGSPSSGVQP